MGVPMLINRVPDLPTFFVENEHYIGFDGLEDAFEKFENLIRNKEMREEIGKNANRKAIAMNYTWDKRVEEILKYCKLKG
jgi:spore maturation protein CgeB